MKELIALSLILSLSACTSFTLPKVVNIPIPVKQPAPTIPERPYLPIAALSAKSAPSVVMKSYVSSITILQGYSDELLIILKSYE